MGKENVKLTGLSWEFVVLQCMSGKNADAIRAALLKRQPVVEWHTDTRLEEKLGFSRLPGDSLLNFRGRSAHRSLGRK